MSTTSNCIACETGHATVKAHQLPISDSRGPTGALVTIRCVAGCQICPLLKRGLHLIVSLNNKEAT